MNAARTFALLVLCLLPPATIAALVLYALNPATRAQGGRP
jgi:hypothetical protein